MAHKLLLADDSVTIQRVIQLTFASEDIEVSTVGDGDQAIARIDQDPPDILLADIAMPGKSGYDVAAHLAQSPRLRHIPIILLTGAFEPVDEARAEAVGCASVLAKPFEPQAVISRVKELLARDRPSAAAAGMRPADQRDAGALDTYFDRLHAAFATLPGASPDPSAERPTPSLDHNNWFMDGDVVAVPVAPSYGSPAAAFGTQAAVLPELTARPDDKEPAPVVANELLEEVTRRVLDRLAPNTVRDTVAGIVSSVAERLVREEIERIKASVK